MASCYDCTNSCYDLPMTIERTLTPSELGKALGTSRWTVIRMAETGRIPYSETAGGHRRFNLEEVRERLETSSADYTESQTNESTKTPRTAGFDAILALGKETPLAAAVELGGISITVDEPPRLTLGAVSHPVRILDRRQAVAGLAPIASEALPIVVSQNISQWERRRLTSQGIGYLDLKGTLHIASTGTFIHVEGRIERGVVIERGHGTSSVRAAQELILGADRAWTAAELAVSANVSDPLARNLLAELALSGAASSRLGRPKTWQVSIDQTLTWLEAQPAARRRYQVLRCSIWTTGPAELAEFLAARFEESDVDYAITGSLAAWLRGAGPANVPIATVRIHPSVPLEDAAHALDARVVDQGQNLVLIRDVGNLGTVHGAYPTARPSIASDPRVYLDILDEARGEDIAEQFRGAVILR